MLAQGSILFFILSRFGDGAAEKTVSGQGDSMRNSVVWQEVGNDKGREPHS